MPEMTLKCEDLNPHVFVTARCSFLSLVHDGVIEVEIVRVVFAAPDGSPSERVVSLRPFIADMGVERLRRLTERFTDEARRLMRGSQEPPVLEGGSAAQIAEDLQYREYFRDMFFAALQRPKA